MISLIFTLFHYTYKDPYLKVNFAIILEFYLILFICINKCGIINKTEYTLNAYNFNSFNSKHSKCTDTYEKINGAYLYGMLHFFNFYLVRENPKTPKYIL